MLIQFLEVAAVVCKPEHQDFKKSKENMGQCESKERGLKE
jgi:hypothetical protein